MLDTADLPDDVAALKAMLIAAQTREAGKVKLYLTDGRIEIDNNSVERTIRPIVLNHQAA